MPSAARKQVTTDRSRGAGMVLTGLPSSRLKEFGVVLYDPFKETELAKVF